MTRTSLAPCFLDISKAAMSMSMSMLGGLLGEGLAVEGWDIQPFLVAVAYVDASVVEDGLFQVSGEPIAGLVSSLSLAHLDKELGVVGVGDAFAVKIGVDNTGC